MGSLTNIINNKSNLINEHALNREPDPLSNDPGKVDSNFFCYAATVLTPHRNVLIFTQRMHKPTRRPFMQ